LDAYGLFAEQAIQRYKELPEEQSELYKRKFLGINPDNLSELLKAKKGGDDTAFLEGFAKSTFTDIRIKFDAIIGASGHYIAPNVQNVHVFEPKEIKLDLLESKMYKSDEDKYAALIHAYTKKLVFIDAPAKSKLSLNILFVNGNESLPAQVFINAGDEADLNVFEWYGSGSQEHSVMAVMHEGSIGKYANVSVDAIHNEGKKTVVLGLSKYKADSSSRLQLNYFYTGGSSTRVKNEIKANGYESAVRANELVFGSSTQKFDISSYVENSAPSTLAELHSKAVLMNESFCIFKGFAKIPFGSKNARSFVHEAGLLLDKSAHIESIPAMSIDENEVKATHASLTGPVDEEAIFYLMSKGLDETRSKKLLVEGFFSAPIGRIKNDSAKTATASLIADKIETGRFGEKPHMALGNVWITRENEEDLFKGHYKYR
jgi:Fe-S cluster assembly scaffold protein SufB